MVLFWTAFDAQTDFWGQRFATSASCAFNEKLQSRMIFGDQCSYIFSEHIPVQSIIGKRTSHKKSASISQHRTHDEHCLEIYKQIINDCINNFQLHKYMYEGLSIVTHSRCNSRNIQIMCKAHIRHEHKISVASMTWQVQNV